MKDTTMIDDCYEAYRLAMLLGHVERATNHPDGTPETDSTHTLGLILLCITLAPHMDAWLRTAGLPPLDLGTLLTLAAVHDLVEAYAGDVNTAHALDDDARAQKDAREADALERIRGDVPTLATCIDAYEARTTLEAHVVHYLDKMTPKITHAMDGAKTARLHFDDVEQLRIRHNQQRRTLAREHAQIAGFLDHLFAELCKQSEDVLAARLAEVAEERIQRIRSTVAEAKPRYLGALEGKLEISRPGARLLSRSRAYCNGCQVEHVSTGTDARLLFCCGSTLVWADA